MLPGASYTPWWAKPCIIVTSVVAVHLVALIVSPKQKALGFIVFPSFLKREGITLSSISDVFQT